MSWSEDTSTGFSRATMATDKSPHPSPTNYLTCDVTVAPVCRCVCHSAPVFWGCSHRVCPVPALLWLPK